METLPLQEYMLLERSKNRQKNFPFSFYLKKILFAFAAIIFHIAR